MKKDFLIFAIDSEKYALDIEYVQKIIEDRACTKISGSSEFVDGVINYEKDALKIVSIRKILGKGVAAKGSQKIIIYQDGTRKAGLRIDYVDKIAHIDLQNAKDGKTTQKNLDAFKIGKVYELEDGALITMIDQINISFFN